MTYNDEVRKLTGNTPNTERCRLYRAFLLRLLSEERQDMCFRCQQPITDPDDFSIEHKEAWIPSVRNDWTCDTTKSLCIENLAISHRHCNYAASSVKKGEFEYLGVCRYTKNPNRFKAYISIDRNRLILSCGFLDPRTAAIGRDLLAMVVRQGAVALNVPELRTRYVQELAKLGVTVANWKHHRKTLMELASDLRAHPV